MGGVDRSSMGLGATAGVADALVHYGVDLSHIEIARKRVAVTHESLASALLAMGLVSGEVVAKSLARAYCLPYYGDDDAVQFDPVELQGIHVDDPRVGVPVQRTAGELVVAILDPEDRDQSAAQFASYDTRFCVTSARTLQYLYRRYFSDAHTRYRELAVAVLDEARESQARRASREEELESALGRRTKEYVIALARYAAYQGASDVQIHKVPSPGGEPVGVVKVKVDGTWQVLDVLHHETIEYVFRSCMQATGINERRATEHVIFDGALKGDEAFGVELAPQLGRLRREFDMRLAFGTAVSGETLTIRFLPRDSDAQELGRLGLDAEDYRVIRNVMATSSGGIIVTGPTGSGKTTLRYSMLSLIDPAKRAVQTIENPVELTRGMWLQYAPHSPNDEGDESYRIFQGMLRNSPDVVDVAEVRHEKGFQLVMRAAATGHLVVVTQHADDAALAIHMLRRAGIGNDDLSINLAMVIGVRLIRLLCEHCKVRETRIHIESAQNRLDAALHQLDVHTDPTRQSLQRQEVQLATDALREAQALTELLLEEERALADGLADPAPRELGTSLTRGTWMRANPQGCEYCSAGYRGRKQVMEVLAVNREVAQAIRDGKDVVDLRRRGIRAGQGLRSRGFALGAQGLTSIDELQRVLPRRRY